MSNDNGQRTVPTRAGWWWRMGNHEPYVEEVECNASGGLSVSICGSDVRDDGTWLAPIPSPSVCAALAGYATAAAKAEGSGLSPIMPPIGSPWRALVDAHQALDAAIRAERDGAA